jgi:carbamoyl-phosphate synthase large subunit
MAVKEAVFPFARFPGVRSGARPEMKSTGEVMGIDPDFATAFLKSQLGAGMVPPQSGTVFVIGQGQRQAADPPGVRS